MLPTFLIMFAMIGFMYFMIFRPQRQQQKKQQEMRNNLGKGDKIVTIGGIHGIVTGLTDKTVSVKVDDGITIKFDRSSVAQVIGESKGGNTEEK